MFDGLVAVIGLIDGDCAKIGLTKVKSTLRHSVSCHGFVCDFLHCCHILFEFVLLVQF